MGYHFVTVCRLLSVAFQEFAVVLFRLYDGFRIQINFAQAFLRNLPRESGQISERVFTKSLSVSAICVSGLALPAPPFCSIGPSPWVTRISNVSCNCFNTLELEVNACNFTDMLTEQAHAAVVQAHESLPYFFRMVYMFMGLMKIIAGLGYRGDDIQAFIF